jgi:hypothetical protein
MPSEWLPWPGKSSAVGAGTEADNVATLTRGRCSGYLGSTGGWEVSN